MHKFLRSIGFSTYRRKRDIERLLASLVPSAKWRRIQLDEETNLCELRAEVAPGMGIVMMGEMSEEGAFQCEYYYPYLNSADVSSETDCSIQRHTEKETYAGLLDVNSNTSPIDFPSPVLIRCCLGVAQTAALITLPQRYRLHHGSLRADISSRTCRMQCIFPGRSLHGNRSHGSHRTDSIFHRSYSRYSWMYMPFRLLPLSVHWNISAEWFLPVPPDGSDASDRP